MGSTATRSDRVPIDHSRRGLVTIYFSGRCTYTDQKSEWFNHRMVPARGHTYPGCVGWSE